MNRSIVIGILLLLACPCLAEDGIVRKTQVKGTSIDVVVNSPTISQSTGINAHGSIVGTYEASTMNGASMKTMAFYAGKHGYKPIPIPKSFTNYEAVGISDTELVIGYATRPIGHPGGTLQGVVWDPKSDEFTLLVPAPGDRACHAQGISADGLRISGYSTGTDRLRPVIWDFDKSKSAWNATVLPTLHENNPYLMSSQLLISPDGKFAVGSCTESFLPDGGIDSSLYGWELNEANEWERRSLSAEQMYVRGVNNRREVVGSVLGQQGGRQPVYVSPKGEITQLELLDGDVSGEARGINAESVIVGMSDDPPGRDGGPEPCKWNKDGKVERLAFSEQLYGALNAINDFGQLAGMIEYSLEVQDRTESDGIVGDIVTAFRTAR